MAEISKAKQQTFNQRMKKANQGIKIAKIKNVRNELSF
jgi:hypothetical protein